jgi:hypothetical protein
MGTTEDTDVNIDIIGLIYRVLKHWRLLILSMLIGGFLFNALGYLKSKNNAESIQQTINDYQSKLESGTYDEKGNTIMSIPEFEKNLTERQINEVNNLVSTYKMYQGPYSNTIEYINKSLLMQIDPICAPTYNIHYVVDNHYTVEYPEITKKDYTIDILNSIPNLLITEEALAEIASNLSSDKETIEAAYIQELITTTIYNDTILITIHGRSKNECETIANTVKKQMPYVFRKLKLEYEDFDYSIISETYFEAYDKNIQTAQQSKADELNNIYKTTQGMIQNITDEQKAYFFALLNNESTVYVELPVESNSSEEFIDPSSLVVPPINKFSIKYSVCGIICGLIISCISIIMITLFRRRIICNDDIETSFNIPQLGTWYVTAPPKGLFSGIDRLIIKLFDKQKTSITPEDMIERIITDIILSSSTNNWNNLFLTTTSNESSTIEAIQSIKEKLTDKLNNIDLGNAIYCDSDTLKAFSNSDAIVIVEQIDISKVNEIRSEYNLCQRYNIPIIGYIMIK